MEEDISYLYRGLRWTARILGGLLVVIFFYLLAGEYRRELGNPDASAVSAFVSMVKSAGGMLFAWVACAIAMAGLILAYWKEGLGGGISLLAFILVYLKLEGGEFHLFTFISLLLGSIPSVLYLIFWWKRIHPEKE